MDCQSTSDYVAVIVSESSPVDKTTSWKNLLPFPKKIPSYLPTAILLSYYGYKLEIIELLRRSCKRTQAYLEEHQDILKQFWVVGTKVHHFGGITLGNTKQDVHWTGKAYEEITWPSHTYRFVEPDFRLCEIACADQGGRLMSLKLTYTDGTQSPLLGSKQKTKITPKRSFEVPSGSRVSKLRACFRKTKEYRGDFIFFLGSFQLLEDEGCVIQRIDCAGQQPDHNFNHWEEIKIPDNQTLIGFRIVTHRSFHGIYGLGVVTAENT